ncbi:MAG TPA: phospholipase D-like domain-containing protein, partial [Saprospiraceae bacterium]|nr:phospholipase D-like domain-containing protein [Saprospiraceae bacterium]
IKYKITPMIMTGTNWKKLTPDLEHAILTDEIQRTQQFGTTKIIFNRGILSTQAFAKDLDKKPGTEKELIDGTKGLISKPGNIWRKRLGGQVLYNIHDFFKQGSTGGQFYAALYELSDRELIDILLKSKGAEIILSSSDSNTDSRPELHKAMSKGLLKVYDRIMKSNSIGHNKFVVYVDQHGKAKSVLTGSLNWTPTGVCGQTNNVIILHQPDIAAQYLAYWNELKADTPSTGSAPQDAPLRTWCHDNGLDVSLNTNTTAGMWFSPNTSRKTKPSPVKKSDIPVDLTEVYDLISGAKKQVLFLVFNPGAPSILEEIRAAADKAKKANKPIFVRGAVSDAVMAKKVTTNI